MMHFTKHHIVKLLALFIAVSALAVIAGWVFGVDQLTRIVPASASINMKFTTAAMFLVSAIGLYFISRSIQQDDDLAMVVLPGISLTIFIVTITMLAGRIFHIPTGIEMLFVPLPDPLNPNDLLPVYGWPSIPTLINFMAFAVCAAVSSFPNKYRMQWLFILGSFMVAIGAIAVTGYMLNMPSLYYEFGSTVVPMAVNTAINFILLGTALVLARRPETTHEARN